MVKLHNLSRFPTEGAWPWWSKLPKIVSAKKFFRNVFGCSRNFLPKVSKVSASPWNIPIIARYGVFYRIWAKYGVVSPVWLHRNFFHDVISQWHHFMTSLEVIETMQKWQVQACTRNFRTSLPKLNKLEILSCIACISSRNAVKSSCIRNSRTWPYVQNGSHIESGDPFSKTPSFECGISWVVLEGPHSWSSQNGGRFRAPCCWKGSEVTVFSITNSDSDFSPDFSRFIMILSLAWIELVKWTDETDFTGLNELWEALTSSDSNYSPDFPRFIVIFVISIACVSIGCGWNTVYWSIFAPASVTRKDGTTALAAATRSRSMGEFV